MFMHTEHERRATMVKEGRVAELWADVTPEMKSEEEKVEQMYIWHPSAYPSQSLDKFISKLDIRLDSIINSWLNLDMTKWLGKLIFTKYWF